MKNTGWGRGRGGGLNREGGLINFPLVKRGGAYLRGGGLIEDLRYSYLLLTSLRVCLVIAGYFESKALERVMLSGNLPPPRSCFV